VVDVSGRWARVFSGSALRLHVPMLLGVALCLWAGWFELGRARAGHTVAWVYTFEWPAFAVGGVLIWWRLLREPGRPRKAPRRPTIPDDDPGLQAWLRYRSDLERDDLPHSGDAS